MSRSLPTLGPRGEGWLALQGVILLAVALAGLLGPDWDGQARLVTGALGLALVGSGGLLMMRGLLDLRENLTPLPYPRLGGRLVDSGAYGVVRHPIYGGLVTGGFGWGLVTASPVALIAALGLLAFFDLKSRREEAWLEATYAGYGAYRRRTRRILPFLY